MATLAKDTIMFNFNNNPELSPFYDLLGHGPHIWGFNTISKKNSAKKFTSLLMEFLARNSVDMCFFNGRDDTNFYQLFSKLDSSRVIDVNIVDCSKYCYESRFGFEITFDNGRTLKFESNQGLWNDVEAERLITQLLAPIILTGYEEQLKLSGLYVTDRGIEDVYKHFLDHGKRRLPEQFEDGSNGVDAVDKFNQMLSLASEINSDKKSFVEKLPKSKQRMNKWQIFQYFLQTEYA